MEKIVHTILINMKKWIIGAAIAGFGGFSLIYLLSEEKTPRTIPLSRTVIIAILKELKRELVGPLISLANLALSIKSELSKLKKSEIKSVIEANCKYYSANLISQIKLIEKRVYSRYNTTKKAVRKEYEEEYSSDK